jgi:hypothetical protein
MCFRKLILYSPVFLLVLLTSMTLFPLSTQKKYQTDTDIKQLILKNHPIQPGWHRMEVRRLFPDEEDVKASHYLSNPADACRVGDYLYVVDYGLGQIIKFDKYGLFSGSFGRRGQGPGEFSRAGQIAGSESGEIFVVDSARIQCFSSDGIFLRNFKVYLMVNDMVIKKKELLVNALYGFYGNEKKPLIVRYDDAGNALEPFGERIDQASHYSVDSRAYLNLYKEQLLVAFRHYPVIRLYDEKGTLFRESRIRIPILARLERYNYDKEFTNPVPGVINLTRAIAGIQTIQDRIFILLHLPRIEIHEVDLSGKVINSFYSNHISEVNDYHGFIIWPNGRELIAYVISSSPSEIILSVLSMNPN